MRDMCKSETYFPLSLFYTQVRVSHQQFTSTDTAQMSEFRSRKNFFLINFYSSSLLSPTTVVSDIIASGGKKKKWNVFASLIRKFMPFTIMKVNEHR